MKLSVLVGSTLLTLSALSAYAQTVQPVQSKRPTGQFIDSTCPAGQALNGIQFQHPDHQDYTYEESFSAICINIPPRPQFQYVSPGEFKKAAAPESTTLVAPPGGFLTGIGFEHATGQNLTYQEQVRTMSVATIDTSNCQDVTGDRGLLLLNLTCSPNQAVTGVSFTHNDGMNLVYQESVTLTCCPFK